MLLATTVLSWRTSPVGLVALAMMCGGDGLADIAGRNLAGPKLPYNPEKSVIGSFAMLLGAPSSPATLPRSPETWVALRLRTDTTLPGTCFALCPGA